MQVDALPFGIAVAVHDPSPEQSFTPSLILKTQLDDSCCFIAIPAVYSV